MKKLAVIATVLVLFSPALLLLGVGMMFSPGANASCTTASASGPGVVGPVPDSLDVTTADGQTFTLNTTQLTHAATIIQTGSQIEGVTRDGLQIALMAALTESNLRMLANTSVYPDSGTYPHDGDASDHDSLGLFQMRPQAGWGTVPDLMDPVYQARAFFGGPTGPNHPSPRGLLDIPGWQTLSKGEAAQAVEVSAYPDRYANYEPVAEQILTTLTTPSITSPPLPETGRVVFPLPEGTWVATSPFGMRVHPITGENKLHTGADYSAPDGTPILASADGIVTHASMSGGYGGLIIIEHTIGGQKIATAYAHLWETGFHVNVGDTVTAGQHIGDVGSAGYSTGTHLHFELRQGGSDGEFTDPQPWLDQHTTGNLPAPTTPVEQEGCNPAATQPAPPQGPDAGDPDRKVDDPTTDGQITARMLHVYTQALTAYPDSSWACYSPRPGTKSEHPLGRACDVTFGNAIGTRPTPQQLETGWALTNWLKDNAETLGVEYLIWQGQIWSLARDAEGWRPYNGGGMHDPNDVTGGHYDHVHITVKEGS
ncbi:M23 family metallopeptidase [Brachybacterium timonense]|uniref:M23 family metallopeptidase n=1 Tax=Brachybacterium timonense TaxID=2050896 RepID=UPI001FE48C9E|nr:M23 family metallopeptidase [Brachybacterium timonense]